MYPLGMVKQALRLGLLATLVVLAVNACGGGQEQADRPRPLPEDTQTLSPGEYRSEEFKPSLSFRAASAGQAHHWKRPTSCMSYGERQRG